MKLELRWENNYESKNDNYYNHSNYEYDTDYRSLDEKVIDALDGPEGYYNVYGEWPDGYDDHNDW